MTTHRAATLVLAALLVGATELGAQDSRTSTPPPDGDNLKIRLLLQGIEAAARADDGEAAYLQLLTSSADRASARSFSGTEFSVKPDRVVVQERDRAALRDVPAGEGFR